MPKRLVLVVVGLVLATILPQTGSAADWPRYGGDDQMTNFVPAGNTAGLTPDAAGRITERWSVDVGGWIAASPLYAAGLTFGDRIENVVFVATNAGTVAALRAEDGTVLWKRQVSDTVSVCGSSYGISSTPVIDRAGNRLFVAGADGLVYALHLTTGETEPNWPVRVIGAIGTEYVWGGLTLAGGRLYVPIASYCDKADAAGYLADGRLVAVDVGDAAVTRSFEVVPGPNDMGGIWGYGGTSIDPLTGHIWTTTGNSWVYNPECDCIEETVGYAEAIVELDTDLGVVAWNRPEGIPYVEDNDFGATPLLFQPRGCPPLAAAHAKNGRLYVWLRSDLGAGPIWSTRIGPDNLGSAFIAQPSFSPDRNTIFVSNARDYDEQGAIRTFDAVAAFAIDSSCRFPDRPTWTAPGIGSGPKTPPLVVGDLVFVPGGYDAGVFALDAVTGDMVWGTGLPASVVAPIAYADGLVLVADTAGAVHAFGVPRVTRGPGGRGLIPR
jgi:outer membrane protein assembly factor BamB